MLKCKLRCQEVEVCFKNVRNLFIWCQLVPHVNSVFLLSFCRCCAVISAEPCIITGHLGAVGRDEPAASDDQTYCVCVCVCVDRRSRSQTHVNGRTFSSYKASPRRSLPSHLSRPQSRTRAVKAEARTVKEQNNPATLTTSIIA